MSHFPQCTIQKRNVHISLLNGALWDMGQAHCGICEIGLVLFVCGIAADAVLYDRIRTIRVSIWLSIDRLGMQKQTWRILSSQLLLLG